MNKLIKIFTFIVMCFLFISIVGCKKNKKSITGFSVRINGKAVSEENKELTFTYGDTIDLTSNFTVYLDYNNGDSEIIGNTLENGYTYTTDYLNGCNAGKYSITISYKEFEPVTIDILVNKKTIDLKDVSWNYSSSFTYDGTIKEVSYKNLPNVVEAAYENNKNVNAGTYIATATLSYDINNYELINVPTDSIEYVITKASYSDVSHEALTGTYDSSKTLASYELESGFSWIDESIVPTCDQSIYHAIYNGDKTNYEDYYIDIRIALSKGNYDSITHDGLTGTYDSNKTLSDYTLNEGYRFIDLTIIPDCTTKLYDAIYNMDPINYNDYSLKIEIVLAKADQSLINVSDVSKHFDNTEIKDVSFDVIGDGTATVEYKKETDPIIEYSNIKPVEIGEYSLRIILSETDNYNELVSEYSFEIKPPYVKSIKPTIDSCYKISDYMSDYDFYIEYVDITELLEAADKNNLFVKDGSVYTNMSLDEICEDNANNIYIKDEEGEYYSVGWMSVVFYLDLVNDFFIKDDDGCYVHVTYEDYITNQHYYYSYIPPIDTYIPLYNMYYMDNNYDGKFTKECDEYYNYIDVEWSYYISEDLTPTIVPIDETMMDPIEIFCEKRNLLTSEVSLIENAEFTKTYTVSYGGKTCDFSVMYPFCHNEDSMPFYLEDPVPFGTTIGELKEQLFGNNRIYDKYFIYSSDGSSYEEVIAGECEFYQSLDETVGDITDEYGKELLVKYTPVDGRGKEIVIPFLWITVGKGNIDPSSIIIPTNLESVYGNNLDSIDLSIYETTDGYFYWTDPDAMLETGTIEYEIGYHPYDERYDDLYLYVEVNTKKATPTYNVIKTLYGETNEKIETIILPLDDNGKWSFENKDAKILDGINEINLIFTPNDSVNYETITVKVSINGATRPEYAISVPTDLTAKLYQKLSNIELPESENGYWVFNEPNAIIDKIGEAIYGIKFVITNEELFSSYKGWVDKYVFITCEKGRLFVESNPTVSAYVDQLNENVKIGSVDVKDEIGNLVSGTWSVSGDISTTDKTELVFTPTLNDRYDTLTVKVDANIIQIRTVEVDPNEKGYVFVNQETISNYKATEWYFEGGKLIITYQDSSIRSIPLSDADETTIGVGPSSNYAIPYYMGIAATQNSCQMSSMNFFFGVIVSSVSDIPSTPQSLYFKESIDADIDLRVYDIVIPRDVRVDLYFRTISFENTAKDMHFINYGDFDGGEIVVLKTTSRQVIIDNYNELDLDAINSNNSNYRNNGMIINVNNGRLYVVNVFGSITINNKSRGLVTIEHNRTSEIKLNNENQFEIFDSGDEGTNEFVHFASGSTNKGTMVLNNCFPVFDGVDPNTFEYFGSIECDIEKDVTVVGAIVIYSKMKLKVKRNCTLNVTVLQLSKYKNRYIPTLLNNGTVNATSIIVKETSQIMNYGTINAEIKIAEA